MPVPVSGFCRICLEPSRRSAFHPSCRAPKNRDRCKLAVLLPVWPIDRARDEQDAFRRVLNDLAPGLPPELWTRILSFASPDTRTCAEYRADKYFAHVDVSSKSAPRYTRDGIHFLRSLTACPDPRHMYLRQEETGQGREANATTSDLDETPRFAVLSYDDFNCVSVQFSDDVAEAATAHSGPWYRVISTATLAGEVDIILKSGMVFFNISSRQGPLCDCVWSKPCLPPDHWYRSPELVNPEQDPATAAYRFPVRMKVLGDLSHAEGVTFANRHSLGICAILIHDGDKRAERAFYDQLQGNEVCQYVPLGADDSVVRIGIFGFLLDGRLGSPCIALSIAGAIPRNIMSGPYFCASKREFGGLYYMCEIECPPGHHITDVAVNESWYGWEADLRLAAWHSEMEGADGGKSENPFLLESCVPAYEPSDDFRISSQTGRSTWSTVTIGCSDSFIPCLQDLGDYTVCLGLRIQRGEQEEMLGQWRLDACIWTGARSCADYKLRRVLVEERPQVQLIATSAVEDAHGTEVVPLSGELEWLTDGTCSDVVATIPAM